MDFVTKNEEITSKEISITNGIKAYDNGIEESCIGTVANSCSTMHKIHSEKITLDDFSFDGHEDLEFDDEVYVDDYGEYMKFDELIVTLCEYLRCKYLKTNDKRYWRYLIQLLPNSYNQKRTVQLNYQVLKSMYFARRNHKLSEWRTLCEWMEERPYFREICIQD